jgi:hypothetical protein
MKFLELTEEAEKALAQVVDHALKAGGLAVHHLVNQVMSTLKDKPPEPPVAQ